MTREELDAALERLVGPALEQIALCLGPKPPRNAQSGLAAAKMVLDRKLPPIQKSEIYGKDGGPLQSKITIEIVRPLAVEDAESTRKARIPSRTIDAA